MNLALAMQILDSIEKFTADDGDVRLGEISRFQLKSMAGQILNQDERMSNNVDLPNPDRTRRLNTP